MKIYVVGIGPGGFEQMTPRAEEALRLSEVLIGYDVYIELIRDRFSDKEFISTPMKKEADRCRIAIDRALQGATVAMISSGDAGVYGMAGIVYELSEEYPALQIEVIPGITAACSGAAVLGAPLIHDFAVISLSDLLTPWEKIETRLAAAAQGDFVICLYNPSSIKRQDYLEKACNIVMKFQKSDLVCGIARSIGRDGQTNEILTLKELRDTSVDMFTTVIIGNSTTKVINGKMVTPRGYKGI